MLVRVILIFILGVLITSCSSKQKTVQPSEESINLQETTLKKLYIGQNIKDVTALLSLGHSISFEVVEQETHYVYQSYRNFDTNTSLGIFFVDRELASVISDIDAIELFACRTSFKNNGKHWLAHGIKAYSDWIIQRNVLDKDFDYRLHKSSLYTSKSSAEQNFENVTTAIAYSPFLIIGSPFILYAWATGEFEKDELKRLETLSKSEFARDLKLGTSIDALTAMFGFPIKNETVNGNLALVYEDVYYGFGFKDEKNVIWKESPSMLELHKRQARYGDSLYGGAKCENLNNG